MLKIVLLIFIIISTILTISLMISPQAYAQSNDLPPWIKNTAGWWATGNVSDQDFINSLEYLMREGIIKIPATVQGKSNPSQNIPAWIKNNAEWWSQGLLTDNDFINGIQYLVQNGIISTSSPPPLPQKNIEQTSEEKINEVNSLIEKGWNLSNERKYQEAIKVYKQVLEVDSKNFSALWQMGTAYLQLRDYENAIKTFESALAINKNDTYVLTSLGRAWMFFGNFEYAEEYYDLALKIDPNYEYAQHSKKLLQDILDEITGNKKSNQSTSNQNSNVATSQGSQTTARDLTGTWSGKYFVTLPPSTGHNCVFAFPMTIILTQVDNYATGTYELGSDGTLISGDCSWLTLPGGKKGLIHFTTFASGFDGVLDGTFPVKGSFTTDLLEGRGENIKFEVMRN